MFTPTLRKKTADKKGKKKKSCELTLCNYSDAHGCFTVKKFCKIFQKTNRIKLTVTFYQFSDALHCCENEGVLL